jgi:hypothetical protein
LKEGQRLCPWIKLGPSLESVLRTTAPDPVLSVSRLALAKSQSAKFKCLPVQKTQAAQRKRQRRHAAAAAFANFC